MTARTFGVCGHCGGPRDWRDGIEGQKVVCPRCEPFFASMNGATLEAGKALERVCAAVQRAEQRSWNQGRGDPGVASAEALSVAALTAAQQLELQAAALRVFAERWRASELAETQAS